MLNRPASQSLSPTLLREIGEAAYGPRFRVELARRLGVADRTVRRWLAGEWPVPDRLGDELRADIDARIEALRALRRMLR